MSQLMFSKNAEPRLQVRVHGTRGIPAAHGGFETFAGKLAPFLRDHGWFVTVYCQEDSASKSNEIWEDQWEGIRRVHIHPKTRDVAATIEFDWKTARHAQRQPGVDLVLGYNTAFLLPYLRAAGRTIVVNMDGIEWKRAKWSKSAKLYLRFNEWLAVKSAQYIVADHPEIRNHLMARGARNPIMIPYGSDLIQLQSPEPVFQFGLQKFDYFISIARIEPENSILEVVRAFSLRRREQKLVVLGKLSPDTNIYHKSVMEAANNNVIFPGAIYDESIVKCLRFYATAYIHGHQVGGTNPSLVESLGSGRPVIAHDNLFNRWTAGQDQFYFNDVNSCGRALDTVADQPELADKAGQIALLRHQEDFTWDQVLNSYNQLLHVAAKKGKIGLF